MNCGILIKKPENIFCNGCIQQSIFVKRLLTNSGLVCDLISIEKDYDSFDVLVISQDLDELMEISDSFMVLSEGQISTPRPAKGITIEAIGLMMGGTKVA